MAAATEAQVISRLSELHNDISCQIDLNPPEDVVSPHLLKLHMQQLADTLATYKTFILYWNILLTDHAANIGVDGMQAWRQWKTTLDAKFKAFKQASSNKSEELDVDPPMARHLTHNPNVDNLSASMDVTSISAIQQSLSASQAAEKKADAAANIKASIDHSMLELRDLTAQYSAADDWETADDHEVETAMSDIK